MAAWRTQAEALLAAAWSRAWLRWAVANLLGWPLALTLGLVVIGWAVGPLGLLALLPGGVVVGGVAGLVQAVALWPLLGPSARRWPLWSAAGGAAGALLMFVVWVLHVAGPLVGFGAMGALFGLALGAAQGLGAGMRDGTVAWAMACTVGGCGCGALSFTGWPFALSVVCSAGPLAFALLTFPTLREIMMHDLENP